jgi:parvulin-like peptidyl-prolyl isomerase
MMLLTEDEQAQVLANPDHLKGFLRQIYLNKRMTAEAERLGLERTPQIQVRLAAERQRVLAEALRQHTEEQIGSPDFAALAREQYAVRREEFQLPEQFRVAHILKKASCDCERDPQRQRLQVLRVRIQAGEDFATLARAESDDAGSASEGGDLGRWVKREELVAPFADALAKLEPGQTSDVVETKFGLHLIKKLDYQPARPQTFEEVQPTLEQRLRKTYVQDQLQQRLLGYLPGADAKFDESALDALLRKP